MPLTFIAENFNVFNFTKKYDLLISFANHHTTDQGMRPKIRSYYEKLHNILNDGGIFLFESHPQEVDNITFLDDIESMKDLFIIKLRLLLTDGKLGGRRYYYMFEKAI